MVRINSRKRSEQIKNDDNETLSPEPDTKRIKEDETHATFIKPFVQLTGSFKSINAAGKPAEVGEFFSPRGWCGIFFLINIQENFIHQSHQCTCHY